MVGERAEVAVLREPLRRGLGADPGHAGEVVALLADQGREVGVEPGRDAVALLDRGRVDPGQVADALAGVEHRDVVGDELEGVPVTGDDRDVEALGGRLVGERGDDVVGLEALGGHDRDLQRVEDLADQAHLAVERARRLVAVGLVLGIGSCGTCAATRRTPPRGAMGGSSRRVLMSIAVKP